MRSPVLAVLWENWRLTRLEVAQRLVHGIVVPAAILFWAGSSGPIANGTARWAFFLVGMNCAPLWLAVARLNGGRFMDGYRPGYPFYFLYTRPVRTFVMVGPPVAYLAASAVAVYLVSALVLRAAFGYPFPLLPIAVSIASYHATQWAVQWGTGSKPVQWVGSLVAGVGFMAHAMWRFHDWPARSGFSVSDYILLASIGAVSFGLTMTGVARQRRGDARAFDARTLTRSSFSNWVAGVLRFPCSTSSPARAQIWLDLRSSGLPVLAGAAMLATVFPLLFAASGPIAGLRPYPIGVAMIAAPVVLLFFAGNAFDIRRKQGRIFASTFEATLPCRTAPLAAVKVLVRAACVLAALIVVGMTVWGSLSLVSGWMTEAQKMAIGPTFWELPRPRRGALVGPEAHAVLLFQHTIREAVRALAGYQLLAVTVVISVGVAAFVAMRASHVALRARFSRRLNIAIWLLLIDALVLVSLALAVRRGFASPFLLHALLNTTKWVAAGASLLATVCLFWSVFAERLLTLRSACGVGLVSAAFGAAWIVVLRAGGVQLAAMPTMDAVWMLSPTLLPLLASVLAPWSLNRVRHL